MSPPARATQITISNPSAEPLRLQLSAFAWVDAADDTIKLTPAPEVILFPQLVTIPGFGKQEIRAAILTPPGAVERTYRIVIDVLPPQQNIANSLRGRTAQLVIRTRFTVPIFQEPLATRLAGAITVAVVKHGTVTFTVLNSGNAHLGGDAIRIIGRDGAGGVIFSQTFRGWSVLVGDKRAFTFQAPQAGCGSIRSVTIAPPAYMNVPPKRIEVELGACGA